MNRFKNTQKKCFSFFLIATIFISLISNLNVNAEDTVADIIDYENFFKDGEYEISTITKIHTLESYIDTNKLSFKLSFEGKEVYAEGNLYKLQGAALYSNALVMDTVKSSSPILFCALSNGQLITYDQHNPDEVYFDGKMMLTCVVRWDDTKEIYIIKTLLDEKTSSKAAETLNSIVAIDFDNPMYEKLLLAGDWPTIYIKENRMQIGQIDTITIYRDSNASNVADEAENDKIKNLEHYGLLPFIEEEKEGLHKAIVEDVDGWVTSFSICDAKKVDGLYIFMIAIHEVKPGLSGSSGGNRDITFEIKRQYNYFISKVPGAALKESDITVCDSNSTYVITQNPGIAVRIVGDGTKGYFKEAQFQKKEGGSGSTQLSTLTNSVLKSILGVLCSEVGTAITATDIFATGLDVLLDWNFNNLKFIFKNEDSLYRKAIAAVLPAQLYKESSELHLTAYLTGLKSNSSSLIEYEYTVEIIGSRNYPANAVRTLGFHTSRTLK